MDLDRETDRGTERLWVPLPAVLTVDLRLHAPRYASLPNIMKAKKRPIEELFPAALGLDSASLQPRSRVTEVEEPARVRGGVVLRSVDELLAQLRERGLIG